LIEDDLEFCVKYPFHDRAKKYLEGMDAKNLDKLNPAIIERAFERLTQAMESGIVSKRKIPAVITKDEREYHEQNMFNAQSWNVISQFLDGKIKVIET
jgi:DNA-binding transcriptional regulator YhcF (GntR family)